MKHVLLIAYCLIANLAVIGAVLALLRSGLRRTRLSGGAQTRTVAVSAAVLFCWYVSISVLGLQGAFAATVANVPVLPFGIVVPLGIGLWLFLRSESLKAAAAALPVSWLIGIQAYRVIGVAFLFVWISGEMPAEAAIPGGAGDILVGLLAIPAAMAVNKRLTGARSIAYGWNYLGILDFATGIATGYLTSPGPLQLLALNHPNTMISHYPMVLFAVFAIPISSVLHGVCLWRLGRETNS